MDFNTYLVRKQFIRNMSKLRPSYVYSKLYSLFRDVVENDKQDEPDTKGLTTEEYPLTAGPYIQTYLIRKGLGYNSSKARPSYVYNKLYSLFRDVVEDDKQDEPDTKGLTTEEYPLEDAHYIQTYLVRKGIGYNLSKKRPTYVYNKLYSLFRDIVEHDVAVDDPDSRGLTENVYPFEVTVDSAEPSAEPVILVMNDDNYVKNGSYFVIV
jgi:acyl-CoA-binding protein